VNSLSRIPLSLAELPPPTENRSPIGPLRIPAQSPISRPKKGPIAAPVVLAAPANRCGYRIAEAAECMGLSPWFIEEKIRAKELPALRLCRHYTILKKDMDAFLVNFVPKNHEERWIPLTTELFELLKERKAKTMYATWDDIDFKQRKFHVTGDRKKDETPRSHS
jgi:excisionase family DNA binding protein